MACLLAENISAREDPRNIRVCRCFFSVEI